jgi:hypothetical protein
MGSEGISKLFNKTFWPFPWQLVYKKETPITSEDRLIFSSENFTLPYNSYLLLQIYKSSISSKKTTNESPTKNMGIFHFVITESRQAIPHGFTWVLKASPNFSTRCFGLFHGNSSIKRRLLQPQRSD